jgi:hypothetical protein
VTDKTAEIVSLWRRFADDARLARRGKLEATGTVTLIANAASTVVTDARASFQSFIGFMPTTANAATEVGNGTIYVSTRNNGSFTLAHANNAQTDRTFAYLVIG